ncbi:hypothetical protein AM587_10004617 [Phytophthora nicotianae]|uniref:Uncharacterized protein n=1 Tax=Phytophthora nicotianae TaxID=4792 RepID=A0A0W8CSV8_PHYNI|nr:hypothetical protein AM587_10004617 [Phytophthora nicotianae]
MSGSLHRAPVVGMSRENLSNTTVAERNSRIDKNQSTAVKIPEEWVQYARMFVCTHYGTYKTKGSDVRNLVRKLKERDARDGPSTAEKRLKKWMKQFGDTPGKGGRIFVDDINQ